MDLTALRREEIRARFEAHVAGGGHPAEFPGVANVSVKPPLDVSPEIICRVSVKGSGELRRRAPCNVCGYAEKFRDGGYLVRIGSALYIIGSVCGQRFLGTAFIVEERLLAQSAREERAAGRLEELGASAPGWIAVIDALLPLAETSDRVQQVLRVSAGRDLRRWLGGIAHTYSGQLVVRDENGVLRPLGRVAGASYLEGTPGLTKKLQSARSSLKGLLEEGWKPEQIKRHIGRLRRDNSLVSFDRKCRDAVTTVEAALDQIGSGQRFFASDNWAAIENWLNRPDCPVRGAARQDGTRRKLTSQADGGGCFLEAGPLIAASLPKLPGSGPDQTVRAR